MGVRRIVLLTLGWEELPKSVYGASPEERLREPVPGVLLECDGGWLLLDTGFNTALIRDLALRRRYSSFSRCSPPLGSSWTVEPSCALRGRHRQ